jgi:molecular chaperone DnaK (HSP70)
VAWALSTDPHVIKIVSSWESDLSNNRDNHKVPSVLTYDKKLGQVTSWGYKLEHRKHHISWFKLALSKHAAEMVAKDQPERVEKLDKLLSEYDKEPAEVAADYLRCLWTHTEKSIIRTIGREMWENVNLKIVLTVPAIWDYAAQEQTRRAAKMAGLLGRKGTTLELVGEPEAAALSVFDELERQKRPSLKVCGTLKRSKPFSMLT